MTKWPGCTKKSLPIINWLPRHASLVDRTPRPPYDARAVAEFEALLGV